MDQVDEINKRIRSLNAEVMRLYEQKKQIGLKKFEHLIGKIIQVDDSLVYKIKDNITVDDNQLYGDAVLFRGNSDTDFEIVTDEYLNLDLDRFESGEYKILTEAELETFIVEGFERVRKFYIG